MCRLDCRAEARRSSLRSLLGRKGAVVTSKVLRTVAHQEGHQFSAICAAVQPIGTSMTPRPFGTVNPVGPASREVAADRVSPQSPQIPGRQVLITRPMWAGSRLPPPTIRLPVQGGNTMSGSPDKPDRSNRPRRGLALARVVGVGATVGRARSASRGTAMSGP